MPATGTPPGSWLTCWPNTGTWTGCEPAPTLATPPGNSATPSPTALPAAPVRHPARKRARKGLWTSAQTTPETDNGMMVPPSAHNLSPNCVPLPWYRELGPQPAEPVTAGSTRSCSLT
jgi:hypothetical protein